MLHLTGSVTHGDRAPLGNPNFWTWTFKDLRCMNGFHSKLLVACFIHSCIVGARTGFSQVCSAVLPCTRRSMDDRSMCQSETSNVDSKRVTLFYMLDMCCVNGFFCEKGVSMMQQALFYSACRCWRDTKAGKKVPSVQTWTKWACIIINEFHRFHWRLACRQRKIS